MNSQDQTPKYRISVVAHLTGISTHALRNWERRYRLVRPQRTGAGDRLYSEADVSFLRRIRELVAIGHPISLLARMDTRELDRLSDQSVSAPDTAGLSMVSGSSPRKQFMELVARHDLETARVLLSRIAMLAPARELAVDILAPLARDIRDAHLAGSIDSLQMELAESEIRSLAICLMRMASPPRVRNAPLLITATAAGAGDGLLSTIVALTGSLSGWITFHAGTILSPRELGRAAAQMNVTAILVTGDPPPAENCVENLEKLRAAVGRQTGIIVLSSLPHPKPPARGMIFLSTMRDLERWLLLNSAPDPQRNR